MRGADIRWVAATLRRLIVDPIARSELIAQWRYGARLHQPTTFSMPDRYPRVFGAVRDLLAGHPAPCLLSFGCAAGQEVVSLRSYFPDAIIVGAELNPAMLRACAALPADPRRQIIVSTAENIRAAGPFDAIFCMAVLTHRPHWIEAREIRDISRIYPFDRFADQLRELVGNLKAGGLLVVEHTLYRAEDVAGLGVVPASDALTFAAKGPRFDPAGRRIEPQPVVSRIFRKISVSQAPVS